MDFAKNIEGKIQCKLQWDSNPQIKSTPLHIDIPKYFITKKNFSQIHSPRLKTEHFLEFIRKKCFILWHKSNEISFYDVILNYL